MIYYKLVLRGGTTVYEGKEDLYQHLLFLIVTYLLTKGSRNRPLSILSSRHIVVFLSGRLCSPRNRKEISK